MSVTNEVRKEVDELVSRLSHDEVTDLLTTLRERFARENAELRSIVRDHDTIAIEWHIDDVFSERPDLSAEQALDVLQYIKDNHDASIGVNWDVINYVANLLYPVEGV